MAATERDGVCNPVAYVLCRPNHACHKTFRTGLQIPSGCGMPKSRRSGNIFTVARQSNVGRNAKNRARPTRFRIRLVEPPFAKGGQGDFAGEKAKGRIQKSLGIWSNIIYRKQPNVGRNKPAPVGVSGKDTPNLSGLCRKRP